MTSDKLNKLETEIATLLLEKLEHQQLTPERMSKIAKFVLQSLPQNLTDQQIDKIIPSLDDHFFELAGLVNTHLLEYENKRKDNVALQAETLIHQGKIEHASQLMRQYFNNKDL